MAQSKQAAVGFRVHSGWSAVVAVCLEKGAPVVLARQRVHLVETFSYEFRQPYHTAEKMLAGQGREFIQRIRDEAPGQVSRRSRGFELKPKNKGWKSRRSGFLLVLGRPFPRLKKSLRC